jgi:phage terminase small subunit
MSGALMGDLTAKQQRFVEEYLIDLNATQAAIRAGYSEKTAYSIGNENLSKPEIAKAIETAQQERSQRTEITADRVPVTGGQKRPSDHGSRARTSIHEASLRQGMDSRGEGSRNPTSDMES